MKNSSPFPMNSRIALVFSLLLLFAGIYFGGSQILTEEQELNKTKPTTVAFAEGAPVSFVSQGNESASSDSDLVKTYSQLYGKFQLKAFANRQFSMPTDQEIEADFRRQKNHGSPRDYSDWCGAFGHQPRRTTCL